MTAEDLPRMLFFRWTRPGQPQFLLNQLAEHLACLRLFFDVELIDHACDYDEVCDRFQPDVVLFESGVYVGERQVTNLHTHPEIPRLGFLNADAFDPVRAAFVSDMAEWGVETFFSVSLAMTDYTPEIADRIFSWPNFIDPHVHRDHGLQKVVPIILTGSQARHYPWRNRVSRVLEQHYPVITMPHFGWAESSGARRMSIGEKYSRLINSAAMAPTCGSFTRDLVRKHLEIPAARTCLIAERTPALEAAGYVDMANCVLADADDVLDKVDQLLREPDRLQEITDAGFRLVHTRHTARQRRQIRDWFDLYAASGSASDIVQDDPFAPLRRGEPSGGRDIPEGSAADRELIRRGWGSLERGRQAAAIRAFTGASNFQYMPEAEVGKAFAQLSAGEAEVAGATIATLLGHNEALYAPTDPDPAQWATHVRTLVCRGLLDEARAAAAEHAGLGHPELDRVRAVVVTLTDDALPALAPPLRASVSPPPATAWPAWVDSFREMLAANGRGALADRLTGLAGASDPAARPRAAAPGPGDAAGKPAARAPITPAPSRRSLNSFLGGSLGRSLGRARGEARERAASMARRWVTAAWLDALSDAVEREDLETVLLVAPSRWSLRERSLRLAVARNPRMPDVVHVEPQRAAALSLGDGPTLVYLGSGLSPTADLTRTLRDARVVVVDGVLRPAAVRLVDELLDTGEFEILDHSTQRGGYYVLRHRLGRPVDPATAGRTTDAAGLLKAPV